MGKSEDLYDVLGVEKDASPQDIKRAFRTKARECHPDVAGADSVAADAFKRLREAYEVLSDPAQRARYDRRGERRASPFYGSMWNRGTVNVGAPPPNTGARTAGNDLDLEDIFNDFGVGDFGFTGQTRGQPTSGRFRGGTAGGGTAGARPNSGGGAAGARPNPGPRPNPGAGSASGPRGAGPSGPAGPSTPRPGARTSASRPEGWGASGAAAGGRMPSAAASRGPRPSPEAGRDIPVAVDVPPDVAQYGGTVTVTYQRLRRADDGHTLYRYDELHDLKVPPGTRHGETLRVDRMGDAGTEGGAYGDLVADIRVAGRAGEDADRRGGAWDPEDEGREHASTRSWRGGPGAGGPGAGGSGAGGPGAGGRFDGASGGARPPGGDRPRADSGRMRMPGHEAPTTADGALRVDIGLVEALLGGRVSVVTPSGTVRVNIPPGTSSGTRMRLRGRGAPGPDGTPGDVYAELRIVVPKTLDEESRRLIERFAELNPTVE